MERGLLETYPAGSFSWILLKSKASRGIGIEEAGVGKRDFIRKTLTWKVACISPALPEVLGAESLGS